MSRIEVRGAAKRFLHERDGVGPLDLTVEAGEFVVVVGPSGCGKTTLVRILAGLEEKDSGHVLLQGKAVTAPGSRVVYVCGRSFAEAQARSPKRAEMVVLHEALHTLGLGENPPDSGEITRRVGERCAP